MVDESQEEEHERSKEEQNRRDIDRFGLSKKVCITEKDDRGM